MDIDVNGTRLWFDVDGPALVPDGSAMRQRPTVVLVHGGPGVYDHSYFKPDFGRLAEHAQVVYLDLRGHGRSDWGNAGAWSFETCADDVRIFCDTVAIVRPIVARRSYAGEPVPDEEWARVFSAFGPHLPDKEREAHTPQNRELNSRGMELMRRLDIVDQLSQIDSPTLVSVGDLDPVTQTAAAEEIVGALPQGIAQLEVVEGAGHFTWMDAPERYWPMIIEFIDSTSAIGGSLAIASPGSLR